MSSSGCKLLPPAPGCAAGSAFLAGAEEDMLLSVSLASVPWVACCHIPGVGFFFLKQKYRRFQEDEYPGDAHPWWSWHSMTSVCSVSFCSV